MRALILLLVLLMSALPGNAQAPAIIYPDVTPGRAFSFPADHGAHPDYRTEWWYVTGSVRTAKGEALGFQITFFRTRPRVDPRNPSAFAAKQIMFAHVALSDPKLGRLRHDQRASRSGFGMAGAKTGDANVTIRDWRLVRRADGQWQADIKARDFALALIFRPTQPVLLQGAGGYSRKGPEPASASYYYSLPHLATTGSITRGRAAPEAVTGRAWLDREWSSRYLGGDAVGWDWTGLNFDDGAALMAFRIRRANGTTLWAGGTYRRASGAMTMLTPRDVTFTPLTRWRSPRTKALYPVAQRLRITLPEGMKTFDLRPAFPDQELDSRASGLPIYWEGLVRTSGGSGYLELTGYAAPLAM
jgi:predicted secreted hydrolase